MKRGTEKQGAKLLQNYGLTQLPEWVSTAKKQGASEPLQTPATLTCYDGTTSALAAAEQTAQPTAESGQRSSLWRLLWTAWALQLLEESPFLQNQEEHKVK